MNKTLFCLPVFLLESVLFSTSYGSSLNQGITDAEKETKDLCEKIISSIRGEEEEKNLDLILLDEKREPKHIVISREQALKISSRNQKGEIVYENEEGNHPVVAIDGIHFKRNVKYCPLNPGRERAAYYFHKLLVGQGVPASTLLILNDIKTIFSDSIDPWNQPIIQASFTIFGRNFRAFLQNWQEGRVSLDDLSSESVSSLILTSLLTCPNDGKADNFIVEDRGLGEKKRLVSIDNDQVFYSSLSYVSMRDGPELDIKLRNILYLLNPLMKKKTDPEISKRILEISPDLFIIEWLFSLWRENQGYQKLCDQQILSLDAYKEQKLPLMLHWSTAIDLSMTLRKLQFWINRPVSLDDLFRVSHPLIYQYYNKLLSKVDKDGPNEALEYLYSYPSTLEKYLDQSDILQDGRTVEEALNQERVKTEKIKEENSVSIEEILQRFSSKNHNLLNMMIQKKIPLKDIQFFARFQDRQEFHLKELDPILDLMRYSLDSKTTSHLEQLIEITTPFDEPLNIFYINKNILEPKKGKYLGSTPTLENLWGYEGPTFWLKRYPSLPGFEQAASSFIHTFTGQGSLKTMLVKINEEPYLCFQKPSTKVFSFNEKLEQEKESIFKKLDPQSVSEMIILSMVLNPMEWSIDDFLLEEDETVDGQKKYSLIAANNELVFAPTSNLDKKILIHSVLFCFDQMDDFIHPRVVQSLQSFFNASDALVNFLGRWVQSLEKIDEDHEKIFPGKLGVPFSTEILGKLTERLLSLSFIFKKVSEEKKSGSYITHKDLLRYMKSIVLPSYYYDGRLKQTVLERFQHAMKTGGTSLSPTFLLESLGLSLRFLNISTDVGSFETEIYKNDPQKSKKNIKEQKDEINKLIKEVSYFWNPPENIITGIKKEDEKTLDQLFGWNELIRVNILSQIDFREASSDFQKKFINKYLKTSPKILVFKHLKEFNNGDFGSNFKDQDFENISYIEIEGCSKITENLFSLLADKAKNLIGLVLSGDSKIGKIQPWQRRRLLSWKHTPFPQLQQLKIKNFGKLESCSLDVSNLKELEIENCCELKKIEFINVPPYIHYFFISPLPTSHQIEISGNSSSFKWGKPENNQLNRYHKKILKKTYLSQHSLKQKMKISPNLENKQIGNLVTENLAESLKEDSALIHLNLKNNYIGNRGAIALSDCLSCNTSLQELDLSYNRIQEIGGKTLYNAFKKTGSLVYLSLNGNPLNYELLQKIDKIVAQRAVREALVKGDTRFLKKSNLSKSIQYFIEMLVSSQDPIDSCNLSEMIISSLDDQAVKQLFSCKENHGDKINELRVLNLGGNQISASSKLLTSLLRLQTNLTELYLQNNDFQAKKGFSGLVQILGSLQSLKKLNLAGTYIPGKEFGSLLGMLRKNTSLTWLGLADNRLKDEEAVVLRDFIKEHPTLKELDLRWNEFTNDGGKTFLTALSEEVLNSKPFVSLLLRGNKIDFDLEELIYTNLVKGLVERIYKNGKLEELNNLLKFKIEEKVFLGIENIFRSKIMSMSITFSNMNQVGISVVAQAVKLASLSEIDLGYNKLKDREIEVLAEGLIDCRSLKKIILPNNEIENKSLDNQNESPLHKLIQNKFNLIHLDVRNNNIGNDGFINLINVLENNTSLKYLDFTRNPIKDEGVYFLKKLLANHTSLLKINLPSKLISENLRTEIDIYLNRNNILDEKIEYDCNKATRVISILMSQGVYQRQIAKLTGYSSHSSISQFKSQKRSAQEFWNRIQRKTLQEIKESLFEYKDTERKFFDMLNITEKNYEVIKTYPVFISLLFKDKS